MKLTITPGQLKGSVTPPPSKSMAHRLIICAALAEGRSVVTNVAFSEDIEATLRCAEALGVSWQSLGEGAVEVDGSARAENGCGMKNFDCGESGSTLRFFIPIALVRLGGGIFTGRGRLMERPQGPYAELFREKGIEFARTDEGLRAEGRLVPGDFSLRGDVSSQFFSGLLFALPGLGGSSTLRASTPLESAPYVEMTLEAQRMAGIEIKSRGGSFEIMGGQSYAPFESAVEADWSQAAFWLAARLLGSQVEICGMNEASAQGDRAHGLAMTKAMNEKQREMLEFDISDCPDLLPPMAAAASLRGDGAVTRFANAARLRIKESDRLASVSSVINALGGRAEEESDALTVYGADSLRGGTEISCCGDHRIAMMAAIAATRCELPVTLDGAECVNKSYPDFWEDYRALGGKADELLLR